MVSSSMYESLLKDLEFFFKCKLKPSANQSCLIKMPSGLHIQIEMAPKGEFLIIGAKLGTLPAGRYRDNILREALRANGLPPPRPGTFAYSDVSGLLVLFLKLDVRFFSADKASTLLPRFTETAQKWRESIERGEIPPIEETSRSGGANSSLFGMIR